ncbi:unnamed protein product [Calypogeia fissa]
MALLPVLCCLSHRVCFQEICPQSFSPSKLMLEFASVKCCSSNGGLIRFGACRRISKVFKEHRVNNSFVSASSSSIENAESGEDGASRSRNVEDLGSSITPHNNNNNNNSSGSSQFIEDIVVFGRQNSLDSIEGLEKNWSGKEEDDKRKSWDSIEGLTAAVGPSSDGKNIESKNNNVKSSDPQQQSCTNKPPVSVEDNAEWRNVFPSYMQSKENDVEQAPEEGTGKNGETTLDDDPRRVSRTAGATQAAVAAVASVKEFDSQFGSQLLSSASPVLISGRSNWGPSPNDPGNLEDLISHDPIWAAIRAEARLEAEREPLLSSFLYASILAHSCFERSLGFVLANRLKNATLLATQLLDVFDDVFLHDVNIRQAIRLDVQAVKDRDPSCRSYSLALLYLKGYHALQAYRIAHALWTRGQKVLAFALQSRISEVFAVDIHPAARLGKALLLDHGTGVVIGETAVVGDRVSMLQGVTLGGTGKMTGDRHPKIKEGVLIGAGATILGNITVGRGAMVASGSLVLKDVPPHSMVAGTPAKVVGYLEESAPSLTMKQDATKSFCQEYQFQHQARLESRLEGGAGI